ncbi:hypothetical protein [Devosia sp. CAU 1758]
MSREINGEQLRADIDSGRTGDKVDFPDPAAAPLATDAEAGGQGTVFSSERRPDQHKRSGPAGFWIYLGLVLAIGAAAVVLIQLALQ